MTGIPELPKVDFGATPEEYNRKSYSGAMAAAPILSFVATLAALFSGIQILLPILTTAAGYPFFYRAVTGKRYGECVSVMILWAVGLSAAIIGATYFEAGETGSAIFHGEQYQTEMFEWVRTGVGKESTPSQFLPEHLWHFAVFAMLAVATGGLLALAVGSLLMGYMSYYVGMLMVESTNGMIALLLGWHVWSVLRVIAYILAAMVLAHLFFAKVRKEPMDAGMVKKYGGAAVVLLIADIALKTLLAPTWQQMLKEILPS